MPGAGWVLFSKKITDTISTRTSLLSRELSPTVAINAPDHISLFGAENAAGAARLRDHAPCLSRRRETPVAVR
ncbi:hypothetical protein GCM10020216_097540 [Nonomuraea helvata]